MVAQRMTASEHAQKALDLLADADADIAAGEYDGVSGKLWSAVEYAVAAVAVERGWECEGGDNEDLLKVVKRIEEECGADGISNTFLAAALWRNNRDYHFLDDYEYELFAPSAHRFVSKALKLNGADVRKNSTNAVENLQSR